jgi:hypothetical protein
MNLDIGLLDRETRLGSENVIFSTATSQEYSTMPIIEEPYFSCSSLQDSRTYI